MSKLLDTVTKKVAQAVDRASNHYGKNFKLPSVYLKESKSRGGYCKFRFSFWGWLFNKVSAEIMVSSYIYRIKTNKAQWLNEVIVHEVAHYITRCLHGFKVKPHGPEWKRVMRVCFDAKPDRCFSLTAREKLRKLSGRCGSQLNGIN